MKIEYCDLCKEKAKTIPVRLPINDSGTQKLFDICANCRDKLYRRMQQAQLDFLKESK